MDGVTEAAARRTGAARRRTGRSMRSLVGGVVCAWAALSGSAAVAASSASATGPNVVTDAAGNRWSFNDGLGTEGGTPAPEDSCEPIGRPGFGLADTSGPDGPDDAVDHGTLVWVGGAQFVAAGTSHVADESDGTPAVKAGPRPMAGLDVSVTHTPLHTNTAKVAAVRTLVSMDNPSDQPITATVEVVSNFGSDAATTMWADADGDGRATTWDRWIATSDDDDLPSDPIVGTAIYGRGRVVSPPTALADQVFDCADTDGVRARYEVTVPAGATRRVASFTVLFRPGSDGRPAPSPEVNRVMAGLVEPATPSDPAFAGIAPEQLAEIVNWTVASANPPPPGPGYGPPAAPTVPVTARPAVPVSAQPTFTG